MPTRLLACVVLAVLPLAARAADRLELRDGDRVAWLGATFVERLQANGYLETLVVSARPQEDLRFRNLGWSGDAVTGISRAVFGSQPEGFDRLTRDLKLAEPTLVLVQYGAVESEQGEPGLPAFRDGLERVLEVISAQGARFALLTPLRRVRPSAALPDPADYNSNLDRYCEVLEQAATRRQAPFIDLRETLRPEWSDNGLHPNAAGDYAVAAALAARLGAPLADWSVSIDLGTSSYDATNTNLSEIELSRDAVRFTAIDRYLPAPPPPAGTEPLPAGRMRVRGLEPGEYQLLVNNTPIVSAGHAEWSAGVALPWRGGREQADGLRHKIVEKDTLFFHRHRPQNETYLFLFRKHEQGNNAVEIPQFDPLIQSREAEIARLRVPNRHRYELRRR